MADAHTFLELIEFEAKPGRASGLKDSFRAEFHRGWTWADSSMSGGTRLETVATPGGHRLVPSGRQVTTRKINLVWRPASGSLTNEWRADWLTALANLEELLERRLVYNVGQFSYGDNWFLENVSIKDRSMVYFRDQQGGRLGGSMPIVQEISLTLKADRPQIQRPFVVPGEYDPADILPRLPF